MFTRVFPPRFKQFSHISFKYTLTACDIFICYDYSYGFYNTRLVYCKVQMCLCLEQGQHRNTNRLGVFSLTSISRTKMNKTTASTNMYRTICPMPGRSQERPWSVYLVPLTSHTSFALRKQPQHQITKTVPCPHH